VIVYRRLAIGECPAVKCKGFGTGKLFVILSEAKNLSFFSGSQIEVGFFAPLRMTKRTRPFFASKGPDESLHRWHETLERNQVTETLQNVEYSAQAPHGQRQLI
jgi:hypothetical protein